MKTIVAFVKKEIVLCAAMLLAVVSVFFVKPDRNYLDYIDFRTLAILFCLMAVMVGLRKIGLFSSIAKGLLSKVKSFRMVMLILVMLCFFTSMLITNDVALITFVPLTIIILKMLGSTDSILLITTIVMQTIAANLGSMLTPIGNPQNLYLYGQSGMSFISFIMLMLPYSLMSLFCLVVWILFSGKKSSEMTIDISGMSQEGSLKTDRGSITKLVIYLLLFIVCLLTVIRIIPYWVVLAIVAITIAFTDIRVFKDVDYCLLLTFVGFFIFIGNMGRIPQVYSFIENIVKGRETATAIISSQVISNVPAALLLSSFTSKLNALIIGTNLGGLGTIIASMASLISFKLYGAEAGSSKGKFMLIFSIANVLFLAVLVGLYFFIR